MINASSIHQPFSLFVLNFEVSDVVLCRHQQINLKIIPMGVNTNGADIFYSYSLNTPSGLNVSNIADVSVIRVFSNSLMHGVDWLFSYVETISLYDYKIVYF